MRTNAEEFPIHEGKNIFIFLIAFPATWVLLYLASHAHWGYALTAVWLFSLVNNTPFSLLHEAVHGIFSRNKFRNEAFGILCAAAFPTSFTMQRSAHLGHHRRNRTDQELYDYYLPGQSRWLRNFWLYTGNLFGLYWWSVVLGNLLYLLAPWAYRSHFFVHRWAPTLGFGPYIEELAALPIMRVWSEIAWVFGYQATIFYLLDLNVISTFACYGAFALHWSVLQYADHAWSARDVRNGAWNLKVLPPFRWVALNYYYHQAHHQHPEVPWHDLPGLVDPSNPQPSFWRIYFSLWKGVRPAPPMGAAADLDFLFPSSDIRSAKNNWRD
jgi:fatty acid desaturase